MKRPWSVPSSPGLRRPFFRHFFSMRDNGGVTVGSSVGVAVARMWVLEVSAEINRTTAAIGAPRVLNEEEFSYWESVSEEILERIWSYLKASK